MFSLLLLLPIQYSNISMPTSLIQKYDATDCNDSYIGVTREGDHCIDIDHTIVLNSVEEANKEVITEKISSAFNEAVVNGSFLDLIPPKSSGSIRGISSADDVHTPSKVQPAPPADTNEYSKFDAPETEQLAPSADNKVDLTLNTPDVAQPAPGTDESPTTEQNLASPSDGDDTNYSGIAVGISFAVIAAVVGFFVIQRRYPRSHAKDKGDTITMAQLEGDNLDESKENSNSLLYEQYDSDSSVDEASIEEDLINIMEESDSDDDDNDGHNSSDYLHGSSDLELVSSHIDLNRKSGIELDSCEQSASKMNYSCTNSDETEMGKDDVIVEEKR